MPPSPSNCYANDKIGQGSTSSAIKRHKQKGPTFRCTTWPPDAKNQNIIWESVSQSLYFLIKEKDNHSDDRTIVGIVTTKFRENFLSKWLYGVKISFCSYRLSIQYGSLKNRFFQIKPNLHIWNSHLYFLHANETQFSGINFTTFMQELWLSRSWNLEAHGWLIIYPLVSRRL